MEMRKALLAVGIAFGMGGCVLESADANLGTSSQAICENKPIWVNVGEYSNPYDETGVSVDFVERLEGAVARVFSPSKSDGAEGWCSGTLISESLFLSAGHCNHRVGEWVEFNHQLEYRDDKEAPPVRFGPVSRYEVTRVVDEGFTDSADIQVVELAGHPGRDWPIATLRAADPDLGSWMTVMGHPHSHAEELGWGAKVVQQGAAMWPESESAPNSRGFLRLRVSSRAGMSGSGALNAEGEVVGVLSRPGCQTHDVMSGSRYYPISRALTRWKARGLTELTSLVKPTRPSACVRHTPPSSQRVRIGTRSGAFYGKRSPSGWGSYGAEGCPYTWVVQLDDVQGKALLLRSEVDPLPTTQSDCNATVHTASFHGYADGQWHRIGQSRKSLNWDNGKCDEYWIQKSVPATHDYSRFRVVTRAERGEQHSQKGPRLQAVHAGAYLR